MYCPSDDVCHRENAHCLGFAYTVPQKCRHTSDCPWGQYCLYKEGQRCIPKTPVGSFCSKKEVCRQEAGCHDNVCRLRCLVDKDCSIGEGRYEGEPGKICLPNTSTRQPKANPIPEEESLPITFIAVGIIGMIFLVTVLLIYKLRQQGLSQSTSDPDLVDIGLPSEPPPGDLPTPLITMMELATPHEEPPSYQEVILSTISGVETSTTLLDVASLSPADNRLF